MPMGTAAGSILARQIFKFAVLCAFLSCCASGHSTDDFRHVCVHDKIVAAKEALEPDRETRELLQRATHHLNRPATDRILAEAAERGAGQGRALLQAAAAQPLRMHAEYYLDGVDTQFANTLQNEVMPRAMLALRRALAVRAPVQGNLQLPRRCSSRLVETGECASVGPLCVDSSGDNALPEEPDIRFFGETEVCDTQRRCTTEAGGAGIPDTDHIVFVTARQTELCGPSTGAYATSCVEDDANWYGLQNRPLAGQINFCPQTSGSAQDPRSTDALVDTATHELLHTLVMSPGLFDKFIKLDGSPLGEAVSGNQIVTPSVVNAVQEHFACPSATGAPLENQGGTATAGSHWEASVFQGEMMIGATTGTERVALSEVTLGIAADSGWYTPDFDAAGLFRWGHRAGCAMLGDCGDVPAGSRAGQYFCPAAATAQDETVCVSHDTTAWCRLTGLLDCPAPQPFSNGACVVPDNLLSHFGTDSAAQAGVYYGPEAICIGVPGGSITRQQGDRQTQYTLTTMCVATECSDSGLTVLIQDAEGSSYQRYPCLEGEYVNLGASQGFEAGTRLGPCPPVEEVCPYKGCPVGANGELCSRQGQCFNQRCHCAADRAGIDCGQGLCESAAECQEGQFCSSNGECSWGTAPPPPPPAAPFSGPSGSSTIPDDFVPMRAVRVGYLRDCVFFVDTNDDGSASAREAAQPTASKGEVGLFGTETEVTPAPVRQDDNSGCTDTLSARTGSGVLFAAPTGIPASGSTVTVFSTAVDLSVRSGNATRGEAVTDVADAFGVAETSMSGDDWLRIMVDGDADTDRRTASAIEAETAISLVLAADLSGALIAGTQPDLNVASGSFLLAMIESAGGQVTATLEDTAVTADSIVAAGELGAFAVAPDAAAAVAGTVALITRQLVAAREATSTDETDKLLVKWAQIAHVADTAFSESARSLGSGNMTVPEYQAATTEERLNTLKEQYSVDLNVATLLETPGLFGRTKDAALDWLGSKHAGLIGWAWLGLGAAVLLLSCCVCCACVRGQRGKARAARAARRAPPKDARAVADELYANARGPTADLEARHAAPPPHYPTRGPQRGVRDGVYAKMPSANGTSHNGYRDQRGNGYGHDNMPYNGW